MPQAEKFTTQIVVTETRVTYEGKNKQGHTYKLYQIIATKPDGSPVPFNLRSFEDMPKGEVLEVAAEIYRSQQYGDSYTLTRKGGSKSATKNELEKLAERVTAIERKLEIMASPQSGPPPPPPQGQPPAQSQGDDDIPF